MKSNISQEKEKVVTPCPVLSMKFDAKLANKHAYNANNRSSSVIFT